jgi:hypothetical protein
MKNLKKIKRTELKTIIGGGSLYQMVGEFAL